MVTSDFMKLTFLFKEYNLTNLLSACYVPGTVHVNFVNLHYPIRLYPHFKERENQS